MEFSRNLQRGKIDISNNAIAAIAGNAALEVYGVLGMASKRKIIDGVAELLKDDSYSKGVFVTTTSKGIEINMYIVCAHGVKITEVVSEVQKKVRYVLKRTLGVDFRAVNVYVQGVQNIE